MVAYTRSFLISIQGLGSRRTSRWVIERRSGHGRARTGSTGRTDSDISSADSLVEPRRSSSTFVCPASSQMSCVAPSCPPTAITAPHVFSSSLRSVPLVRRRCSRSRSTSFSVHCHQGALSASPFSLTFCKTEPPSAFQTQEFEAVAGESSHTRCSPTSSTDHHLPGPWVPLDSRGYASGYPGSLSTSFVRASVSASSVVSSLSSWAHSPSSCHVCSSCSSWACPSCLASPHRPRPRFRPHRQSCSSASWCGIGRRSFSPLQSVCSSQRREIPSSGFSSYWDSPFVNSTQPRKARPLSRCVSGCACAPIRRSTSAVSPEVWRQRPPSLPFPLSSLSEKQTAGLYDVGLGPMSLSFLPGTASPPRHFSAAAAGGSATSRSRSTVGTLLGSNAKSLVDIPVKPKPRRYFDLKTFKKFILRYKQREEEAEEALIKRAYTKPLPGKGGGMAGTGVMMTARCYTRSSFSAFPVPCW